MNDEDRSTLEALSKLAAIPEDSVACEEAMQRVREQLIAQATQPSPDAPILAFRRSRSLIRSLKWLLPLAAAAAVVLVVGLWPAGKSGHTPDRVYALSDMPALMNSARTLHVRTLLYFPTRVPPDQERDIWRRDYWVDQATQSWCWRKTYVGKRPGSRPSDPAKQYGGGDRICDGQYVMYVNPKERSVTYEKPTPFKLRYMAREERECATPLTAEGLEGCAYRGQEILNGEALQIWENLIPPCGDERWHKFKLWFSPQKGEIGRVQLWCRSPETNGQWDEEEVWERFERDVAPPPGTFSTDPPAGYRLANTKQTAEPDTLDTCSVIERIGQRVTYAHVNYELPGRVLLLGWSCLEKGSESASQEGLFKDLVPGGPLPKLPLEIHTFLPNPRVGSLAFIGFHLASTHKNGRYYEWTLYVPNQPAPRNGIMSYSAEYRVHTKGPDEPARHVGLGYCLGIRTATDFDEFVLGAMAELSDGGAAPAGVTYDGVMQLVQQIRASMPAK